MGFRSILALMLTFASAAQADFVTVWSLGTQDSTPLEFGAGAWQPNAPPGSAVALDSDYYFQGEYGPPIGLVLSPEMVNRYKNAISGLPNAADLGNEMATNRIHFHLQPTQALSTSRIRVVIHQVWGGWHIGATNTSGEGYGSHTLQVRLNNDVIGAATVTGPGTLVFEADAGSFTPVADANTLHITRIGGSEGGWIHFDALTFEIHSTALLDVDDDDLPRWWEEDHGLSDTDAADAGQDPDQDGLTNAQEIARQTLPRESDTDHDGLSDSVETGTGIYVGPANTGTLPRVRDTDGDTLSDGEEMALSPRPNPLLTDTDADGAADAWEVRTGYDPAQAGSTPPAFAGAIGINFVSDVNPLNALPPFGVTGLTPQTNWNNTLPLTSWNTLSGSTLNIASPVADTLVNSDGAVTGTALTWLSPAHCWTSGNNGSATQSLLDGYLTVNSDTPASVTLSGIPFGNYDIIVYVGGSYVGGVGYAQLNGSAATNRWFITSSTPPQKELVEPLVSDQTKPWIGNAIRYRNVTGGSCTVRVFRGPSHEVGIHGIQIVDAAADEDNDGLPTAWEFTHRLRPDLHDAALDADGDGLNNAGEYARQTDPRLQDTDGDGLTDSVETGTGVWVGATDTGSNPLLADTDGDSLTDGAEAARDPLPTNPNLADTDGDGRTDADEVARGTNPNSADSAGAYVPAITALPHSFDWDLQNVQIVWDHTRGHLAQREWGSEDLVSFDLVNQASPGSNAIHFGLTARNGAITYLFYTEPGGSFSHPDNDSWGIYVSDWTTPPADLRAALGFSGHGIGDVSDRLRFRVQGNSAGPATEWTVTFSITNQDTGATVMSQTFNGCSVPANVNDATAQWQDRRTPPTLNRFHLETHQGVRVFLQAMPLAETAAFAAFRDSDDDGMPDAWEVLHAFNENSPADAPLDADSDGLTNLGEYLNGTLPRNADTDGDLASDGLEVQSASSPLLATSLPPLYRGLPPSVLGEDFNGNGLPDAWELWSGSFNLPPLGDTDGDGQSNAAEALAGTDPDDAASRLWSRITRQGNDLQLSWPLLNHKQHRALQSTDLVAWSPAGGNPVAAGSEYQQSFPGALNGPAPRFYSAAVSDRDTDNDGVSDWTEANVTGTNSTSGNSSQSPLVIDHNDDGTPDQTLSGDYANLLDRFYGGSAQGGFAGAASGNGISRGLAARFLMQAAFGPTPEDIERVRQLGYGGWIAEQMSQSPTLHSTYIREITQDMLSQRAGGGYNRGGGDADPFLFGNNMMTAFARAAIQGEDQLRQRVAFALSQIMVTSRRDANLENRCMGMADYYDIFVRNAFGNYLDILNQVTMHPVMGRYLSHVGNQKAQPEINQYPDENYAREVMQLFTIGLWELNPDGSRQLDGQGQPIPTYSNTEITQLARVLTGLWFGGHYWGGGGWTEADYATPMSMHADRHDFGQKTLLRGYVIPARAATKENAERDVRDAIRHLFEHPNTAVFVSRQLIQFLVTDNPSPGYVQRIGAVFADNGQGVRGDLNAVVRAILLDEEARDPRYAEGATYGRLKEPVIRAMALGRAFGMKDVPDLLWWDWSDFQNASRQEPTASPSVFNYYRPEYRAPGLLTQNHLAGPVFQITDSFTSISFPNRLWLMLEEGFSLWETYRFPLDLSREKELAADPERLLDYLNTIFCGGRMRASTRALILEALQQIPANQTTARTRVAAYLAMTCPEGAIMK